MGSLSFEHAQYIYHSFAMSAANTWTQNTCNTNKPSKLQYFIFRFEVELSGLDTPVDGDMVIFYFNKTSQTAGTMLNNTDLLAKYYYMFKLVTSGMVWFSLILVIDPPLPVLHVCDNIYMSGNTVGQGGALTFYVRIYFVYRSVDPNQVIASMVKN